MASTPNYNMNLPLVTDSMADVANGFNNAFGIIAAAPVKTVVSALPTTGSFNVGDMVYLSTWRSNFMYMGNDPVFGYIWRPINAKWGPWVVMGALFISDTSNYQVAVEDSPRYRLSNDGAIELGGGVQKTAAGVLPNGVIGVGRIPTACLPSRVLIFQATMYKTGLAASNGLYNALFSVGPSGTTLNIYNNPTGTADATSVVFNGISWAIGLGDAA